LPRASNPDYGRELPSFDYGKFDGVQVVRLPYEGDDLGKVVMLPPKSSDVRSLEAHLRDGQLSLDDLTRGMHEEEFERLEIPKHEVRGNYDLIGPLEQMGIDRIFSPDTAE